MDCYSCCSKSVADEAVGADTLGLEKDAESTSVRSLDIVSGF